jgi:hypothetical protein
MFLFKSCSHKSFNVTSTKKPHKDDPEILPVCGAYLASLSEL